MNNFDNLLYAIDGSIATITLNRPEKRNAFNDSVIAELTQAFEQAGNEPLVRVVRLCANGAAFCAGADLGWMRAMADYSHDENLADAKNLAHMLDTIYHCPKPTIAVIQGDVYAGGMGLVAACDVALCVPSAKFCLSEVRLGLMPATIAPYVIRAMGIRAAHRYFLSAEIFEAHTAKALGFVHELCEHDLLDQTSLSLAQTIAKNSPMATTACKELLHRCAFVPLDKALMDYTTQGIADIRASKDGKEGVQAFLQKRAPVWL